MAKKFNGIDWLVWILLSIGAINFGLALLGINIVLYFAQGLGAKIIYGIIGASAVYTIWSIATKRLGKMSVIQSSAIWILIFSGLNWLLAIWSVNLVTMVLPIVILQNIIYGLVGIAGIYSVYFLIQQAKKA